MSAHDTKVTFILFLIVVTVIGLCSGELRRGYYDGICPQVEKIVRSAVESKAKQTFITVPGTIRLFFHDCIINGCDASIMIASTANNTAEKDHRDNLSLPGDAFDTVVKAKQALDAVPNCRNKVSCADILTMATRDAVNLAGGPRYEVKLGRLDSLSSTAASVEGKLPQPTDHVGKLTALFEASGLNLTDMIALSGAHTLGVSRCVHVFKRLYSFNETIKTDPTLNTTYATQLKKVCSISQDPNRIVAMDPTTVGVFDNAYYENLRQGKGLFTSDQDLFMNSNTKTTVDVWASDEDLFFKAFVIAMTKLSHVGIKTGTDGNIRHDCSVIN